MLGLRTLLPSKLPGFSSQKVGKSCVNEVWAKTFVDTLDQHFRNTVGRMAQDPLHVHAAMENETPENPPSSLHSC